MTTIYNAVYMCLSPDQATYHHTVTDLVTVNPEDATSQMGGHDYSLKVVADVNAILADFSMKRNLDTNPNTHESIGEALAWAQLHGALNTGAASNGASVTSFLTTYSDGDTSADNKWTTFWSGLLSESIDSDDKDGLSVKIPVLQAKLDQPAQNAAANDVIGVLNDAVGNNGFGGADGAKVEINIPPTAAQNYLMAAALFLYQLRGSADGTEGALTGDPSDAHRSFAIKTGDAFAFRFSCSINHVKTGIIVVEQS